MGLLIKLEIMMDEYGSVGFERTQLAGELVKGDERLKDDGALVSSAQGFFVDGIAQAKKMKRCQIRAAHHALLNGAGNFTHCADEADAFFKSGGVNRTKGIAGNVVACPGLKAIEGGVLSLTGGDDGDGAIGGGFAAKSDAPGDIIAIEKDIRHEAGAADGAGADQGAAGCDILAGDEGGFVFCRGVKGAEAACGFVDCASDFKDGA